MWQEIAIILIGIAVAFYIGKKIYGFLKHPKQPVLARNAQDAP